MTPEKKLEQIIRIGILRDYPFDTDLGDDGELTIEFEGQEYLVQVRALQLGVNNE